MKFRPCIDIHEGKVKQIVGGTLTGRSAELVENFVADQDAAHFARLFRADGLSGGHVIMLGPGNEKEAVKALQAFPGGLHIGGGITPENAAYFLERGASHVIVTSYIFEDGEISDQKLERMVAAVGKERLVLDLSCRVKNGAYYVVTDRWQRFSRLRINAANLRQLANSCAAFLIHAADVEGKRQGIQADLVASLGQWTPLPTTYAGGARSIADLDCVNRLGGGRIDLTIGSALDIFGGDLAYAAVLRWQRNLIEG